MYILQVIDKTLESLVEYNVGIGDYVFYPTGTNVAVPIINGTYEEWLLDESVSKGIITSEVKQRYINSKSSSNTFDIHEINYPSVLNGQPIVDPESLMKHLEFHSYDEFGTIVVSYMGGITGLTQEYTFDDIISTYDQCGKIILIKLIN